MRKHLARDLLVWGFAAVVTFLFLGRQLAGDSSLFRTVLTPRLLDPIGSVAKIVPLSTGLVYAARCVGRYERGSTVRRAWIAMTLWFLGFFVGQCVLSSYRLFLDRAAPVPCAGDWFFFAGYAAVIVAAWVFVSAYRASGFPVGSRTEHAGIAAGATLLFALFVARRLLPIALEPTPIGERIVNVGYPLTDLVLLVPTLVLLRITIAFRGGRVWTVWAATLVGILLFTAGDVLFANTEAGETLSGLLDWLFVMGYAGSAYGAMLQHALVSD